MGYASKTISASTLLDALEKTTSRGPDDERVLEMENGWLGFQRLAIMGLSPEGMQPFELNGNALVCNGEIYGFRKLKTELEQKGYSFKSDSDCEILLPLYEEYGTDMFKMLDAEFACILYDHASGSFIAGRDPIGIRPLFYGYDKDGSIVFGSEAKNLTGICDKILPFPPGHYYKDGQFVCYKDCSKPDHIDTESSLDEICKNIHDLLVEGVNKRLDSDAPLGFLLSGGLDSSLVCAIAQRQLSKPIETYAIGMSEDAIDLKYAKEVADYIGSNHHEVIITKEDVVNALREVIYSLATFDITTIRASIGMYLICKAIHEQSDLKVLLTGEISDELFGYKYTDFAPSAQDFQEEASKRIRELYMYDVLRADRCISTHSLEARVPFGDLAFVDYVMAIDPQKKLNTYGKGKYLLRHAFESDDLLPYDILMREKAAFSDAVGHSMADELKLLAERTYSDEEYEQKRTQYDYCMPFTKESLLYREIFEEFYPGQAHMIADFWMPNASWPGCQVNDPSARYLSNYGASGE
jgi:asparagine synthase (glutamine-hydrolysing)